MAARLRVRARRDLVLDGEPLPAGSTRELRADAPRTVEIDDVADIHVAPGGQDLDSARDGLDAAAFERDELLRGVGVTSVAEAEEQARARSEKEARLRAAREQLEEAAPGGVEAVAEAVRAAEAELDRLSFLDDESADRGGEFAEASGHGEREESPADADGSGREDPASLRRALREAEHRREAAAEAYELARDKRDEAIRREADAQRDVQEHERKLAELDETRALLGEKLADAPAEEALAEAIATTQRALDGEDANLAELAASLETAGGDGAEADLEREHKALADLKSRARDLDRQTQNLEGALRTYGGQALHEELEEAESEVARCEDALAHVERRARAAHRLYDTLTGARPAGAGAARRARRPARDALLTKSFSGLRRRPGRRVARSGPFHPRPRRAARRALRRRPRTARRRRPPRARRSPRRRPNAPRRPRRSPREHRRLPPGLDAPHPLPRRP